MSELSSRQGPFDYRLFGLHVRSELELPEIQRIDSPGDPDIAIRLAGSGEMVADKRLDIPGVARFEVPAPDQILVQPAPGASPRNVRLYLLGSVMGMLLHKRGMLPLHASAIEIDGKAVAFIGHSGAGKSTLVTLFHDRGFRIIADDVCVVRLRQDGRPVVVPGMPRIRLWKEALEASGRNTAQFERSYAGDDDWEKYDVPLSAPTDEAETEIAAIYLLAKGSGFDLDIMSGLSTAEALIANTYRGAFVAEGDPSAHWQACLELVRLVPVFRLERQWGLSRMGDDADRILAQARAIIGEG